MREEEACCLELLGRRRGLAVCLGVGERLRPPQVLAVALQGVLILYLLGHHATKSVMLNLQLKGGGHRTCLTVWKMVQLMVNGDRLTA